MVTVQLLPPPPSGLTLIDAKSVTLIYLFVNKYHDL